jgi:cell wall-associated NlpC family hydrolase
VGGTIVDPAQPNSPAYQQLKQYLDGLGSDSSSWGAGTNGLYPRKVVGPGVTLQDNHTSIVGKIVWGEDCTGKQHFDCVYFCMYCYWKTVGSTRWWMGIRQWANNNTILGDVPDGTSLWPGDILIVCDERSDKDSDYHHIGMYDGANGVVQAEMACTGVVTRPYVESKWDIFRRVKPQYLS